MNANAAMAVNPSTPPVPTRNGAATDSRGSTSDRDQFDRRLDAARRQHDDAHKQPAQDDAQAAATAPAAAAKAGARPNPTAGAKPVDDKPGTDAAADTAALTAAMLALLGQVAPSTPTPMPGVPAASAGGLAGHAAPITAAAGKPGAPQALAGALDSAEASPAAATPSVALASGLQSVTEVPGTAPAGAAERDRGAVDLQQLAAQAASLTAPNSPAPPVAAHALSVSSPVGTPTFAQELGQQVAWLGGQDLKQARIRLHPEELGQLDVKLSVTHNRVDVTFAVQHPAAVHAVQQTLAQLDTLLAQHGLALGQAEVGQQQSRNDGQRGGSAGPAAIDADGADLAARPQPAPTAIGLLDTFA
jgi:flagellar hook-length control protein FliK